MARKFTEGTLIIATHNRGKLEEMRALFAPHGIKIISGGELGLAEPEETETTFVGNARIKAHAAAAATGKAALADDSGITVDALGGDPGVYTADWAQTPTGRDFHMAMGKVWRRLEALNAPYPRRAQFRCTLVLCWPDGHEEVFEGAIAGQVVWPMRGQEGHGYDPIFQPDGYNITFGEMAEEEKNRISHRAVAFRKLVTECFT
jgi:XTP/dITP diphosphohydrolase